MLICDYRDWAQENQPPKEYDQICYAIKHLDDYHDVKLVEFGPLKGIVRLVNGDYAWCMVSALMVSFAAPGYTVSSKLDDTITKSCSMVTSSGPVADSGKGVMVFSHQTYTTVHQRNFTYLETGLPAPSIHLRHL